MIATQLDVDVGVGWTRLTQYFQSLEATKRRLWQIA